MTEIPVAEDAFVREDSGSVLMLKCRPGPFFQGTRQMLPPKHSLLFVEKGWLFPGENWGTLSHRKG